MQATTEYFASSSVPLLFSTITKTISTLSLLVIWHLSSTLKDLIWNRFKKSSKNKQNFCWHPYRVFALTCIKMSGFLLYVSMATSSKKLALMKWSVGREKNTTAWVPQWSMQRMNGLDFDRISSKINNLN